MTPIHSSAMYLSTVSIGGDDYDMDTMQIMTNDFFIIYIHIRVLHKFIRLFYLLFYYCGSVEAFIDITIQK